jgi:hypothetical protein
MTTATANRPKYAEQSRLRDRQRVKEQIADAEVSMGHYRALGRQQDELDRRLDEAVDAHQTTCLPLQNQISAIEKKLKAAIVARDPIPSELEDQRLESLAGIQAANEKLEEEKTKLNKLRAQLEREKYEVILGSKNITVLRNSLARAPLANSAKLLDLFIEKQAAKWLEARLRAATAQRETWEKEVEKLGQRGQSARMNDYGNIVRNELEPTSNEDVYAERLKRWASEEAAANDALRDSRQRQDRLYRELVDE